jgi:hypothetical protein
MFPGNPIRGKGMTRKVILKVGAGGATGSILVAGKTKGKFRVNWSRKRVDAMTIPICEEPTCVYPEKEFEMALRIAIHSAVERSASCSILSGSGFDLAIRVGSPEARTVYIEVKSYGRQRQGGVGFGNGKGKGPQVDLLIDAEQAAMRDEDVRWAFVDATQRPGTPRYALLTCSQARNAAMGVVARDKQNNFRLAAFRDRWTAWPIFCGNLRAFLCGS